MMQHQPASALGTAGVELSVIVPTFNERDNVHALVGRLESCLGDNWLGSHLCRRRFS